MTNPTRYQAQWDTWWDGINPDWRIRQDGKLVIGGEGDWSSMMIPGTCGFVLVIGGLYALRNTHTPEAWSAELLDVAWVIEQTLLQHR